MPSAWHWVALAAASLQPSAIENRNAPGAITDQPGFSANTLEITTGASRGRSFLPRPAVGNLMFCKEADLEIEIRPAVCFGSHPVLSHQNKRREENSFHRGYHRKHDETFVPRRNERNPAQVDDNPDYKESSV
jgi:hypothetical protein